MSAVYDNASTDGRDLGEASHVTIRVPGGDIAVRGYEGSTVLVSTPDDGDAESLRVSRDGTRLYIGPLADDEGQDLHIFIPEMCPLEVTSADGDVSVQGVNTSVSIGTGSGDITLSDATGTFDLRASNGDVSVTNANGNCTVTAANGDIVCRQFEGTIRAHSAQSDVRIAEALLRECTVDATNGDAIVEAALMLGGQYSVRSTNGDVLLQVPANTNATVHMRTQNGDLHSKAGGFRVRAEKRVWEGQLGSGGAEVTLESVNGDVSLRCSAGFQAPVMDAPSPAVPPTPAVPPIPPVEAIQPVPPEAVTEPIADETEVDEGHANPTIAILARLERGELTVEEALGQIDAMS